jgi:uncharacterized protein with HEPN domain
MKSGKPRLTDYLGHILEALGRIERYTAGMTSVSFAQSQLVQDAVIRNFEIIGEASRNLRQEYPEFCERHPGLPLESAYGMRNALAHGYFAVDLAVVWNTIAHDLPELRRQIELVRRS